jgi:hypothetical protein
MKKNYFFKIVLFAIPFAAFLLMSNAGGKTGGFSGSPGDGNSCAQCHGGGNFGASVSITSDIPVTGYELNTAYTVTVTATSSAPRHGFQVTAEENTGNTKVGSFTAGSGTQLVNGGANVTHTNPNQSSWTVTWTSPSSDQGPIAFHAAVNAANGNGQAFDGADQVVTQSSTPVSALGISEAKLLKFEMYPNPSSDVVKIQLPSGTVKANVHMYDYVGRLVANKKITSVDNTINVQDLSRGMYLIRVTTDDKVGAQQFIKS